LRAKDTFSADRDAQWQEARAKQVRATLDKEFPGWEKQTSVKGAATPSDSSEAAANVADETAKPQRMVSEEPPAPPQDGDGEASPFENEDELLPVRAGRAQSVYGHSAVDPSALSRGWEKLTKFLTGFRGAIRSCRLFPRRGGTGRTSF
jgi:hypothetical protein